MRKITFYISTLIFLYICYILINIFVFHFENLNDYGNGFLVGNIILLAFFGFLTYKTTPFVKNTNEKN